MTPTPTIGPTRTLHVVGPALVVLAVVRWGLAWWQGRGGTLPIPSYPAWASIALIAVGIGWLAFTTRRLVARDRAALDAGQAVTRLVLGKTSQVGSALMFGGYAALVWAAVDAWPAPLAIERVVHASAAVAACLAWGLAGRFLEDACRIPDDDDADDSPDIRSGGSGTSA